ncbi:MAG: M1 family aminopeptidase, partial [Thermoanaerobaculia bacterium]
MATDLVHHQMGIILGAETHRLLVTTEITLPETMAGDNIDFLLNSALTIEESHPPVEKIPLGDFEGFFGINSSTEVSDQIELARDRVVGAADDGTLELCYAGLVDFGLSDPKEEYTRGFRETAGVLGEEGVYLAGSGFWYPYFDDGLVEFELEIGMPAAWHVISQGNGLSRDQTGLAHWVSGGPMDEIYLVGGPLVVYSEAAGNVEALVYLREQDDALAAKYLEATAQYVEMYRQLIGPYPYEKFALVENFWETGYGMPSFTLLGPRVIRFPFILHSSYPHEILHNWWGNSVFVDYESGNWCEGLTAYLADHLIQEQRGKGHEYRRSTLQKYRDYVKGSRDFPLTEFRSRHSAATEAVGYGKALMGFHMLRRDLGDEAFRRTLARAYRELAGKKASFRDLQKVAESVSGQDLGPFFDDWITRAGAATLEVAATGVAEEAGRFVVSGVLRQVQGGAPFGLDVPVVVQISGGMVSETVHLGEAEQAFSIVTSERPLAVHVDPEFDVFRRLDPRETPPSIGQLFGEPRILALLPGQAEDVAMYRELMEGWRSDSHEIELKAAEDFEKLPSDRPVWLLGHTNRFAPPLFHSLPGVSLTGGRMSVEGEVMPLAGHTGVLTVRHPGNVEKAIGWIFVDPPAAGPGLGRKLPHYGKYSYLGFEGEEPTNVIKGQWPASDSPLR